MIVSIFRLVFAIPAQVKSKALAQKIKDHIWARFKISVAQLDADSDCVVVGCALVGSDIKDIQKRTDAVINQLNSWSGADLVETETEIVHFDDLELERDFEKYNP